PPPAGEARRGGAPVAMPCAHPFPLQSDGAADMVPLDQPPRSQDPEVKSCSVWTREDEPLQYDVYGKPTMSRRAIRTGLAFCAAFYGGIAGIVGIVGIGIWAARHFL